MRVRTKDCYVCNDAKEVLYRCRYQELKDWVFLCGKCLTNVKRDLRSPTNTVALGRVRRSEISEILSVPHFTEMSKSDYDPNMKSET